MLDYVKLIYDKFLKKQLTYKDGNFNMFSISCLSFTALFFVTTLALGKMFFHVSMVNKELKEALKNTAPAVSSEEFTIVCRKKKCEVISNVGERKRQDNM